jgi:hypothetical protein
MGANQVGKRVTAIMKQTANVMEISKTVARKHSRYVKRAELEPVLTIALIVQGSITPIPAKRIRLNRVVKRLSNATGKRIRRIHLIVAAQGVTVSFLRRRLDLISFFEVPPEVFCHNWRSIEKGYNYFPEEKL